MIITKAECWKESVLLTRPYTIAYQVMDSVEIIFLRLETNQGHIGYGSATPAEFVTGESFDNCLNALNDKLEELVLSKDVSELQAICRKAQSELASTPAACAGVDIALWDLYGKVVNKPIVKLLGQYHQSFLTSITIGIKSIEESIEEALEYKQRGFKIIKLKVGKELERDIEMTRKISETVGSAMLIRVDANQGYDRIQFQKYLDNTQSLGLEFVEQPLPVSQNDQMRLMSPEAIAYAAGDESIQKPFDALQHALDPKPFGIYNIKLMKCGGISAGRQIAEIAHLSNINLMWGCMDESCLSISAALHAALASQTTKYIDLDGSLDLAKDLFKGGFVLEDGRMTITGQAGLGCTPH